MAVVQRPAHRRWFPLWLVVQVTFEKSIQMYKRAQIEYPSDHQYTPIFFTLLVKRTFSSLPPASIPNLQMDISGEIVAYDNGYGGYTIFYPDGTQEDYDENDNRIELGSKPEIRPGTPPARTPSPGLRDPEIMGLTTPPISPIHSNFTHLYKFPTHSSDLGWLKSGEYCYSQDNASEEDVECMIEAQKEDESDQDRSRVHIDPHTSRNYCADGEATLSSQLHSSTGYSSRTSVEKSQSSNDTRSSVGTTRIAKRRIKHISQVVEIPDDIWKPGRA